MEENKKEIGLENIVNQPKQNVGKQFTTSAEIRLDQSTKFFLQGKRQLDQGHIEDAINNLKRAIEALQPAELKKEDNSVYYSYLGLAMLKKGWISYAQAQFQQALKLNPNDTIAIENMKLAASGSTGPLPTPKKEDGTKEIKSNTEEGKGLLVKFKSFFKK